MPRPASKTLLAALIGGLLFGFGLAWSTMIRPEIVLGFLRGHDMGLILVLGGGAFTAMLFFQLTPRLLRKPLWGQKFDQRDTVALRNTIVGAAIFGIGWGLSGVCPGPAYAGLGAGEWPLLWVVAGLFLGAWIQGRLMQRK